MTEDWTSEVAEDIFGDKLYQKRARAALPILVRQAEAQQTILYADLATELGMQNPRNLNYVLGSIAKTLQQLSGKWAYKIPSIQCLVVNKFSGLPGQGVDLMIGGTKTRALSPREKEKIVDQILSDVYAYTKWGEILDHCKLERYVLESLDIDRVIQKRGVGESQEHKLLKEKIAVFPSMVGLKTSLRPGVTEKILPSGDKLDVFFRSHKLHAAVEVKSSISGHSDIERGVYQCIKYRAVLRSIRSINNSAHEIDVILALGGGLPQHLIAIKNTLGIRVVDRLECKVS